MMLAIYLTRELDTHTLYNIKRQKLNYKPNPIKTKERKVDFPLKYNLLTRK